MIIAVCARLVSPLGGPASFGYEWKDRKLIPHSTEGSVRKLMKLFARIKHVVRLFSVDRRDRVLD